MSDNPRTVLVTGATGYIGGRLVPRLLEAGHTVKVLVRTPAKIAGVPWLDDVEVVQSSLDDGDALRDALVRAPLADDDGAAAGSGMRVSVGDRRDAEWGEGDQGGQVAGALQVATVEPASELERSGQYLALPVARAGSD